MKFDPRKYSRQTSTQLILGAIIIIFIVGLGLIWLIYGSGAAGVGLICLLAGFIPVLLVVLSLWIIGLITKRNRSDDQ